MKGLSAALAHREFDGEDMLLALKELKAARVQQKQMTQCALALRPLTRWALEDARREMVRLSKTQFAGPAELALFLSGWAQKLKTEKDLKVFCRHVERMALTAGLLSALRRASQRLVGSRG